MIDTLIVIAAVLWPVLAIADYTVNNREPGPLRLFLWLPLFIPLIIGYFLIGPYMRFSDWLFEVRE